MIFQDSFPRRVAGRPYVDARQAFEVNIVFNRIAKNVLIQTQRRFQVTNFYRNKTKMLLNTIFKGERVDFLTIDLTANEE